MIVGSGAGAIVGAAVAMGMSTAEALGVCAPLVVPRVSRRDVALPRLALTSGAAFTSALRDAFGDTRIEDLDVVFHVVATDLTTGAAVVIDSGEVWRAVRASAGTPGVVPPIRDGDRALVDGGVVDTFPVSRTRILHPGITIIGSDVTTPVRFTTGQLDAARLADDGVSVGRGALASSLRARLSPRRSAQRLTLVSTMQRLAEVRRDDGDAGDIAVRPPIDGFGVLDVDRGDELVRLGSDAARVAIESFAIDSSA